MPIKSPTKFKEREKAVGDKVLKTTRKGPLGQLIVRSETGLVNNETARVVRQFEENVGGVEEIADKLAALPDASESIRKLLELIDYSAGARKSLGVMMVQAGVRPAALMDAYARGAAKMGMVGAIVEAHRHLPRIMKDLALKAIDREEVCGVCVGSGAVKAKPNYEKDTTPCPQCKGEGKIIQKASEFAVNKIWEATKLKEQGPMVQVTQQQLNVGGGGRGPGSLTEKLLLASDAVLYPAPKKDGDVIEVEVLKN